MKKLITGAGLAAAAWFFSHAYRSARRQRETQNVREEVKRWEGEGGSLPDTPQSAPPTDGMS